MSGRSGEPKVPDTAGTCQFCGVATPVPHEKQEACIAALHTEIGRMRGILATLRPAGPPRRAEDTDTAPAATIRLTLD
jgi:hypothetical protein